MAIPTENKRYYDELNLFRGFAIFSIVFGHAISIVPEATGLNWTTSWSNFYPFLAMAYTPGGSWFFVFISGFLFYPVFYSRGYEYKKFIRGKLEKVFLPFLIFAIPYVIYTYTTATTNPKLSLHYVYNVIEFSSYWYFPFIMCMFLISPLFVSLLNIKFKYQVAILIFSIFASIAVGRLPNNPFISCIYFFPAYFLGIVISMNYDKFLHIPANTIWSFLFLTLGLMAVLSATGTWYEINKTTKYALFAPPHYSAIVKVASCILYLYLFIWIKNKNYLLVKKILKSLAKYSFTIFFFHQFILRWFHLHPHKEFFVNLGLSYAGYITFCFLASVLICIVTMAIFAPLKSLLGKYSRMIIGC